MKLEFEDTFDAERLDESKWVPYYLPQWSSREKSAPRYAIENGALVLRIDHDQQPWCPEFDGEVKCSSIQTGLYSGPLGSPHGQHRFNRACVVREAQETRRTYTPLYGYFEIRMKAVACAGNLVALWMIGFEENPEQSGEIVVFEVFGDQITSAGSEVRYGVKAWGDPALTTEMVHDVLPIDATEFHTYAVDWTPTHIDFYVDGIKRCTMNQSPSYPMQFMLGIYELPGVVPCDYPKRFVIDYFRGYRR